MTFLSEKCRALTPYTAGEQPQERNYIKLNTNENPYPPSPRVAEALAVFDTERLRKYPDPDCRALKAAIAAKYDLGNENVFVGNGSDEVLAMCFPAFFDGKGDGAAFFDVTYSFYKVWAAFFGIPDVIVALKDDYSANLEAMSAVKCQGMIICNPNAPTGIAASREELVRLITSRPDTLFIVDEAYAEFSSASLVDCVKTCDNLLVVRTLSKAYGLAGLRCGYAVGNSKLIGGLTRVKDSFNSYTVGAITQAAAQAALGDADYYAERTAEVVRTREESAEILRATGFRVLPSASNFLFAKHGKVGADEIYFRLKEAGVLVRHFEGARIEDFIRITIGTPTQMKAVTEILKGIVGK